MPGDEIVGFVTRGRGMSIHRTDCINIINLSDTQDLVTVMYCNEIFNPEKPDTFFDKVIKE